MAAAASELDDVARSSGIEGVFVVALADVDFEIRPLKIGHEIVTAYAPHPTADDLVYLTNRHPEMLSHLPDPYVELNG